MVNMNKLKTKASKAFKQYRYEQFTDKDGKGAGFTLSLYFAYQVYVKLGGKFVINIDFSDNYPFKCPVMKFKTKIYHPNVKESSGEICDQAIKNTWVPTLNANYLIKMLKELIENPSTDAPMEADTAAVFMQDNAKFKATA